MAGVPCSDHLWVKGRATSSLPPEEEEEVEEEEVEEEVEEGETITTRSVNT